MMWNFDWKRHENDEWWQILNALISILLLQNDIFSSYIFEDKGYYWLLAYNIFPINKFKSAEKD